MRKSNKAVLVGGVQIGGGARVTIQSMTTEKTADIEKTLLQIHALKNAGCDIVRGAILDEQDALAVKKIVELSPIPFVADIHFSPKLAVMAIENGAHKVRINPGNIGGETQMKTVADCIKAHRIPVRVGANTGSIEKEYEKAYGRGAKALVESALNGARTLEKYGVEDIVLSVKASSVPLTVEAYSMLSNQTDYPLHIGVTEAGTYKSGVIKSAVGIGSLLLNGIGDTLRVSLADDPVKEVETAKEILRACDLDKEYAEVVACPTCGRCLWDSMSLAKKVTDFVAPYKKRVKIAVMGCIVNGPGEAKDADLGVAGGENGCLIFKKGEPYKKVSLQDIEEEFFKEIRLLLDE